MQNLPRRRSAVCGGPCRVCGECAARETGSHCPGKRVAMQDFQTVTAYKGAPFIGGKQGHLRESACQKLWKRIARLKPGMKNALRMRRGALRGGRTKRITERCGEALARQCRQSLSPRVRVHCARKERQSTPSERSGKGAPVTRPVGSIPRVTMGRNGEVYNRTVRSRAFSLWYRQSLGLRVRTGSDGKERRSP